MKPIYEFQTIQVELTNACIHSCSNCTRFCGHHKQPFFMDWDTFKKAIDTLEDWPRCVGIMGGEPTLHPQFECFVRYAHEKHPPFYQIGGGHKPISSLSKYIIDANGIKTGPLNKFRGLGLWSSVCDKYFEHYELIQDIFSYQCINDHTASSRHQAWLMTRKEFGISDEEWIRLRDNCWWQRLLGSPSITPKGAFFCEVAAAMDMLFDGPGGWKIEKGWWKRGPEDYTDQLHWCELCSGAFLSFDRDANEMVDDVSPAMYEMLKKIDSPKLKRPGSVLVHDVKDIPIKPRKNMLLYQPDHELRFTQKNTSLYPKKIIAVAFCDDEAHIAALRHNRALFDAFFVVTDSQTLAQELGDAFQVIFRQGKPDTRILATIVQKAQDWVAVVNESCMLDENARKTWKKTIFNPGTMHVFADSGMLFFNVRAKAKKEAGFDGIAALKSVDALPSLWPSEKVAILNKGYERIVSPDIAEWTENITKAGIMHWNYLADVMNNMRLRREVIPQIEAVCNADCTLAEKLRRLDEIDVGDCASEAICDKIKTAIHNELGRALGHMTTAQVQAEISQAQAGFCARYALAMLTTGAEKETHLTACVLHARNTYRLGLATLKLHYDAYCQSEPLHAPQQAGTLPEIVSACARENELVLVGNRYCGKSVEMILAAAARKPCCFMDEERQGFGYDGLKTLSVKDTMAEYAQNPFLWTECGDFGNHQKRLLERAGWHQVFRILHPLTIAEMSMTPSCNALHLSADMLRKMDSQTETEKKEAVLRDLLLERETFEIV